jgi:adenylate cyclase
MAERLEFTVIGQAANPAARIESMCKQLGEDILLSEEFARHFPERVRSLGCHQLRGIDSEAELFSLAE